MNILSPSLLSVDFNNMGENLKLISDAGAEYVHVDVMDGMFVPNISFGPPVIKHIRKATDKILDVHLMIEEPIRYIDTFKSCGSDILTVHAEACKNVHSTVMAIKNAGMRAAVALNPATPVSYLENIIDELDMVLIMSVNPGFGGQKFLDLALNKISQTRKIISERGLKTDIEVDGGINFDNLSSVLSAGANVIVAGTSVFKGDIRENIRKFLCEMNKE